MITKQRTLFYFVGDEAFKSLEEAQKNDLKSILPTGETYDSLTILNWLLTYNKEIVDILTTTPTSRARARKLHGGVRKKKVKVAPLLPDVTP